MNHRGIRSRGVSMSTQAAIGLLVAVCGVLAPASAVSGQLIRYETIAKSADDLPGTSPGDQFQRLGAPLLSENGDVAFWAHLRTLGPTQTTWWYGVWVGPPGSLKLVMRTGWQAPGLPQGQLLFPSASASVDPQVLFSSSGGLVVQGSVSGPGVTPTNDWVSWIGRTEFLPMFREGQDVETALFTAPINQPAALRLSAADQAIYALTAGQLNAGVWRAHSDGAQSLFTLGDPAPGTNHQFSTSFGSGVAKGMNDSGQVVFYGKLAGTGITTNNNEGLWLGTPGSMHLVVREGASAADLSPFAFSNQGTGSIGINNMGEIAFQGWLNGGPGLTQFNNMCIWAGRPENLRTVARSGDPAPGCEPGTTFTSSLGDPVLSGGGQVAFVSNLNGPSVTPANARGLWVGMPGALKLVVRTGMPVPGRDPEVVFSNIFEYSINARGQVLFWATFSGPGVVSGSNGVLCLWTGRVLLPVIGLGMSIDLSPQSMPRTDLFLVNSINAAALGTGGQDGLSARFNDAGQVVIASGSRVIRTSLEGMPCQPCDIASDSGEVLPSGMPNSGVNEGDFNAFFQGFFDAASYCDIADDAGIPLTPFSSGQPVSMNSGVTEGDYNCFFAYFFLGCD